MSVSEHKARQLLAAISRAKRSQGELRDDLAGVMACYQSVLALRNWIDFDDMVGLAAQALDADPGLAALHRDRFRWIAVDEFQDVDAQQYRLLRLLAQAGANLCVIGDPDQAIYGFRGADAAFERFRQVIHRPDRAARPLIVPPAPS
jgi:superfamily I DNA/RNA helicase